MYNDDIAVWRKNRNVSELVHSEKKIHTCWVILRSLVFLFEIIRLTWSRRRESYNDASARSAGDCTIMTWLEDMRR